jgi:N-acetyl-anhydromuramyl-L-alanine amidase AmpD
MNIVQYRLLEDQYYPVKTSKKQIVLHHTAGGPTAESSINWWKSSKERVATAFVIDRKGVIYQTMDDQHWAHHLGTKLANNVQLNKQSIGIELCCYGSLKFVNGQYINAYNTIISSSEVVTYDNPFRGTRYFQKYTSAQLQSLRELLQMLLTKHNIHFKYNAAMWDLCTEAMKGQQGIYTHVSYRTDKSDCHPQPELIALLKELSAQQQK